MILPYLTMFMSNDYEPRLLLRMMMNVVINGEIVIYSMVSLVT